MIGKVQVFKLRVAEAVQALKLAENITIEILGGGSEDLLYVANCERIIKEAHIKVYSQRNKTALDEAERAVEKTLSILDKIVGSEKPNYIYARALLGLADIQT